MAKKSQLIVIDDSSSIPTPPPGQSMGLVPRDFKRDPYGSLYYAKPFNIQIIDKSERADRANEQKKNNSRLYDIRNKGMWGGKIPSRDQNGKGYSHTEDTEVLTEKGWVRWPDWNHIDMLGTVNPLTHRLEFQEATEWHAKEYRGETYHSTNRRIDFGVTNYHRMYVRKWDEAKRTLSSNYSFQLASELGWYVGLLAAPSGWLGTELVEVEVPGDRRYDGDDFLSLLALITSDGYAGGSENTHILVSFCCFDERYTAVAALASRVGFCEQPSRKGVFNCRSGALAEWVRANCYTGQDLGSTRKCVPSLIKVCSERQIKHFLHWFGDRNKDGTQPCFYSSSKRLIDDLQELLLRIGKRGTICRREPRTAIHEETGKVITGGPSYVMTVAISDKLCIDKKKHIEQDRYNGLVYCATVPNGLLITRRNGSVLTSSNCWGHSPVTAAMAMRAFMNMPYVDLSAYSVACPIKNWRDEGGWNAEAIEWMATNGVADSIHWPQKSMERSNWNDATKENAKLHIFTEWMDLDPDDMWNQLATCLLLGYPVASDFNWWSHSVCSLDYIDENTSDIWNSWGDSWSDAGIGQLKGSKRIPDSAIALIGIKASLT